MRIVVLRAADAKPHDPRDQQRSQGHIIKSTLEQREAQHTKPAPPPRVVAFKKERRHQP